MFSIIDHRVSVVSRLIGIGCSDKAAKHYWTIKITALETSTNAQCSPAH